MVADTHQVEMHVMMERVVGGEKEQEFPAWAPMCPRKCAEPLTSPHPVASCPKQLIANQLD